MGRTATDNPTLFNVAEYNFLYMVKQKKVGFSL